ncbi:MAG: hypothetical protein NVSMB68_13460 [Thermoanaerobaculia bacterium]
MTSRTRRLAPVALYAVLAILVVPVFPHFVSPNEFSRWVLGVAIVDEGTVEVTGVVTRTHTGNEDLASIGGRLLSNKAPGATIVALPAYFIARLLAGPATSHNVRVTLNAMRLLASTVPAILLSLWLAAVASRFGCEERPVHSAVVALLFGTPLFAYGLLFFAHALSAFALFGAFALLFSKEDHGLRIQDAAAGALVGLAVIAEYPNVIPAAVLVACALPRLRVGGTIRVMAGGLPFAIVLGVYNKFAFGSVFTLSSAHESNRWYRELARAGLFGVGWPSPGVLLHLLLDPAKGLFVFSPVLAIALVGVGAAVRTLPRATALALIATPLSILLTFSGYPNWHGGWTVGARYLVPALPFLALLIAFAGERWIASMLLGASVAATSIVTLVFPFVGLDYAAPWISFSAPLLRDGHVMPNVLHLVSRPLAIVVPFLLVLIAATVGMRVREAAMMLAGAAIWFSLGLPFIRSAPRNLRVVVEQVYFQDAGAIRRAVSPGDRNVNALEAIARRMETSPPDSWPF